MKCPNCGYDPVLASAEPPFETIPALIGAALAIVIIVAIGLLVG